MPNVSNIYVTGFMGVGKSTVAERVARDLGWEFIDLDHAVEKRNRSTINSLTDRFGLSMIRKLEAEVISEVSQSSKQVLALGAGTLMYSKSMGLVKQSGLLVYLSATVETIVQRLVEDTKKVRPLLGHLVTQVQKSDLSSDPALHENYEIQLIERINDLIKERGVTYSQAEIEVSTDGRGIEAISREIVRKVSNFKPLATAGITM